MVNINNVYQKVLALANKEQRGYITPQEFNLFADRAQNEIYENYFHQLNIAQMKPKSQENHSDIAENIKYKLEPFIKTGSTGAISTSTGYASVVPLDLDESRIISFTDILTYTQATKVDRRELTYILGNPLTTPTQNKRIYVVYENQLIKFYPTPIALTTYLVEYFKNPTKPNWTYVVLNEKALYNASASDAQNFELHASEEENLVSKILTSAGLTIKQPDVQQAGVMSTQINKQEQNS